MCGGVSAGRIHWRAQTGAEPCRAFMLLYLRGRHARTGARRPVCALGLTRGRTPRCACNLQNEACLWGRSQMTPCALACLARAISCGQHVHGCEESRPHEWHAAASLDNPRPPPWGAEAGISLQRAQCTAHTHSTHARASATAASTVQQAPLRLPCALRTRAPPNCTLSDWALRCGRSAGNARSQAACILTAPARHACIAAFRAPRGCGSRCAIRLAEPGAHLHSRLHGGAARGRVRGAAGARDAAVRRPARELGHHHRKALS